MFRNLLEAIGVEGAELIGTAKGYDLFDIRTYEAAQRFVIENSRRPAGETYVQNEATFNEHINDTQHLYFFVRENTNEVYAAAVKSNSTSSDIIITGQKNDATIHVNFLFETNGQTGARKIFPLFLIPNIQVNNTIDNMLVVDNVLLAVLPQLTAAEGIDLDLSNTPQITSIASTALYFNQHINSLTIGDNIQRLGSNGMFDNVDRVLIDWLEKPAEWPDNWDDGYDESKITYIHADEIENIRNEKERAAELARQQALEAERQRIEQERLRAEQAAELARIAAEQKKQEMVSNIRYKKIGKEITIFGVKLSYTGVLDIPETIEGLPVTKIAPYAFYQSANISNITLPRTIKEIGAGAFAYTNLARRVAIRRDCILGKNAFFNSNGFVRRDF